MRKHQSAFHTSKKTNIFKNIILIINKILISKGLEKFSLLLNGGGREFVGNEARKQSQNKSNKKTKQAKFS